MPDLNQLIAVMLEARSLLEHPDNNFDWSSWHGHTDALGEVDAVLDSLRAGRIPAILPILFAPTGPIQEVSLSSGWGDAFIALADRFDAAMAADPIADVLHGPEQSADCACRMALPGNLAPVAELGMDSRFAEISVLTCRECGVYWLRYLHEVEAFTGSGRWYCGMITPEQFAVLTAANAKEILESLEWYYYGGSYYEGRSGKASGMIAL